MPDKKINIRVVVPSKGRWEFAYKSMLSKLPDPPYIVCPAGEEGKYRRYFDAVGMEAQVVPHPKKSLVEARNWMMDTLWEPDIDMLVMMDDDIKNVYWSQGAATGKDEALTGESIMQALEEDYHLCKLLGSHAFSFRPYPGKIFNIDRFKPIKTVGKMVCCVMGFVENKYRFDETLRIRDDYEFSMQLLFHTGIIFTDGRYVTEQVGGDMGTQMGGLTGARTTGNLRDDTMKIVRKYGKVAAGYLGREENSIYGMQI